MKLLFLDTETTDCNETARLIQLAYKKTETGEVINEYFKPPIPISFEAMSVHHVTNEAVANKPSFTNSSVFYTLLNDLKDNILVAHNAGFDVNILRNEGIEVEKYIDTLNLSRHLIKSPQHKLQYLRYFLNLNVAGSAHEALSDITVLEALFMHLKELIIQKYQIDNDEDILIKMFELNSSPVLLENITFGKHFGKTFVEISATYPDYLNWLLNSELQKSVADQNRDLVFTLKHYL